MILDRSGRSLDLSIPRVMGILNLTPDSFSDGGRYIEPDTALQRARQMVAEGAAVIDVGGESTRPGAQAVGLDEELQRVIPVIERITDELDVVVSVDTSKPQVMRAAVAAGAVMINDVGALQAPGALAAAAETGVAVCLMHMQGTPRIMQQAPVYADVVGEVRDFLAARVSACEAAGVVRERVILDPGFGFGKTLAHNLSLLKHMGDFSNLGLPLLLGVSRKSMIGAVTGEPVEGRLHGSVAAATLGAWFGAAIVRVHDVKASVDAMRMVAATRQAE